MTDHNPRRPLGRRLLAIFFPERCAACGEVIRPGEGVCPDCRDGLPRIGVPICPFCGREAAFCHCGKRRRHFERVVAPLYYDGVAERGMLRMKASGDRVAAAFFAGEMAETVRQYYADIPFDGVVFVPSGRAAMRERGYNPGRLVAEELARDLGLPVRPLLKKVVENRQQKTLSASERSGNVLGVFDLVDEDAAVGKIFLLADDIVTTGSTLDECAKMLKIYGAQAVYAVAGVAAHLSSEESDGARGETA